MNSKINSPMGGHKDMGKTAPGHFDHLTIPVGSDALRQSATPNAVGIRVRTGEMKPGSPGGSSKIDTPMGTKPGMARPSKMK